MNLCMNFQTLEMYSLTFWYTIGEFIDLPMKLFISFFNSIPFHSIGREKISRKCYKKNSVKTNIYSNYFFKKISLIIYFNPLTLVLLRSRMNGWKKIKRKRNADLVAIQWPHWATYKTNINVLYRAVFYEHQMWNCLFSCAPGKQKSNTPLL